MPLPPSPLVGTCGFSYQEWRGRFYPPDLPQSRWLGFYAQVFDALELDGTFYRPPSRPVVEGWARMLPEVFAVAAKVPRTITHELRLEGEPAAAMLRSFAGSLAPLGDRLLAVVLQLPPSLTADEGRPRLERLLATRPEGLPVVVEVRHRSWNQPWLAELLASTDASVARVEWPELPSLAEWAGPLRFARLLGDCEKAPWPGTRARDLAGDLDRWTALATDPTAGTPAALFIGDRDEAPAFELTATLRARLGRPAPEPRTLWPTPQLPGFESFA